MLTVGTGGGGARDYRFKCFENPEGKVAQVVAKIPEKGSKFPRF
jgi:hypothetical protein